MPEPASPDAKRDNAKNTAPEKLPTAHHVPFSRTHSSDRRVSFRANTISRKLPNRSPLRHKRDSLARHGACDSPPNPAHATAHTPSSQPLHETTPASSSRDRTGRGSCVFLPCHKRGSHQLGMPSLWVTHADRSQMRALGKAHGHTSSPECLAASSQPVTMHLRNCLCPQGVLPRTYRPRPACVPLFHRHAFCSSRWTTLTMSRFSENSPCAATNRCDGKATHRGSYAPRSCGSRSWRARSLATDGLRTSPSSPSNTHAQAQSQRRAAQVRPGTRRLTVSRLTCIRFSLVWHTNRCQRKGGEKHAC